MRLFTTANGNMIGDSTVGVDAASAGARIDATVVDAALVARTVRVEDALGSTRGVRISDIISRANAIDGAVLFLALSVGTTRIGIARSWWLNNVRFNWIQQKIVVANAEQNNQSGRSGLKINSFFSTEIRFQ